MHSAALHLHHLYATAMPDRDGIAELRRQCVDVDNMADLIGPVVRVLATFTDDGQFYPDPMGEASFLIPVMGEDAETHVDLVAWAARDPENFGTLLGAAGLLGADAIVNPANFRPGPCPIWPHPLSWLIAKCEGAVVLDPELARVTFAKAPPAGSFAVDSLDAARELIAFGCVPVDRLLVRQHCDREAA